MDKLTITRPDDWHIHLRDGAALATTVADASRYMGRAIIMPNLVPPVVRLADAQAYHRRIMAAGPRPGFEPLMTLYLTETTTVAEIEEAAASGLVKACKLYPAGATTNSESGVRDVRNIYPLLAAMQDNGLLLLVHGEVTDAEIDIFDREKAFLETYLADVVATFPKLKVVLEHITTEDSVEFVRRHPDNLAATITAHHLMFNRNHMLAGGIRPHYYCLPILKRNRHQQALISAATSGDKKFFLGTDSAPHPQDKKESSCGCAGAYTAHAAIELYAEVFEQVNALDKLEAFASFNGPDFYGLPRHQDTITLQKQSWQVPATLAFGDSQVVPIKASETLSWQVTD